jgi:LysM repeat protein
MTRTIAGVLDWVKTHPKRPDGNTWDGWCEALVADSGGFTNSFDTAALELARVSKLYKPSQVPAGKAPDGWLYHWAYVDGHGHDYGHVAFAVPGGLALMASSFITRTIGDATGTILAADYEKASGHEYLGASPDHGGQYLTGVPHVLPAPALPKPKPVHVTVVRGDTLTSIAAKHGLTLARVELLNPQIHDFDLIHPGDQIRVK